MVKSRPMLCPSKDYEISHAERVSPRLDISTLRGGRGGSNSADRRPFRPRANKSLCTHSSATSYSKTTFIWQLPSCMQSVNPRLKPEGSLGVDTHQLFPMNLAAWGLLHPAALPKFTGFIGPPGDSWLPLFCRQVAQLFTSCPIALLQQRAQHHKRYITLSVSVPGSPPTGVTTRSVRKVQAMRRQHSYLCEQGNASYKHADRPAPRGPSNRDYGQKF